MQVVDLVISAGTFSQVNYAFITDTHVGVINCDEELFKKTVQVIEQDQACWWIFGGDAVEAINYSDRRWMSQTAAPWLKVADLDNLAIIQLERFLEITTPIHGRCLGIHEGNHERTIRKRYHVDLSQILCDQLKVPYLGSVAQIRLRIERENDDPLIYNIYSTHGSSGQMKTWARKVRASFNADIFQRGHIHSEKQWFMEPRLGMRHSGKPHTTQQMQLFLTGGSFYRTYLEGVTSYGEEREYPPAALGNVKVCFDVGTGKFWCQEIC